MTTTINSALPSPRITDLPKDVVYEIVSHLDITSSSSLERTCKHFLRVVQYPLNIKFAAVITPYMEWLQKKPENQPILASTAALHLLPRKTLKKIVVQTPGYNIKSICRKIKKTILDQFEKNNRCNLIIGEPLTRNLKYTYVLINDLDQNNIYPVTISIFCRYNIDEYAPFNEFYDG